MDRVISIRTYAKHRDVSPAAVSKAIKVGRLKSCIERNARGQPKIRSAKEADDEWAKTTRPPPRPAIDGSGFVYAIEAAEEKHWKAKLAELEYKTKAELLIPAAEARDVVIERFAEVKTRLLALAHHCKAQVPRLTIDEVEIIEKIVDDALEALADEGDGDGE